MLFDEAAKVAGLAIDPDERDGQFWVVVGCSPEQRDNLHDFYAMLAQGPIGFGEGGRHPPTWPDPAYPAQIHFDIAVADLDEAEPTVVGHGGRKLADFPAWRVCADPVGHPFCLYPDRAEPIPPTERLGTLARVVIDCAHPAALATSWAAMLDLPRRIAASPDRIVIGRADGSLPMIALQQIADYRPPRWPDPHYPAQMHFDLGYDNRPQKGAPGSPARRLPAPTTRRQLPRLRRSRRPPVLPLLQGRITPRILIRSDQSLTVSCPQAVG